MNKRIIIVGSLVLIIVFFFVPYARADLYTNMPASVVVGQKDFSSRLEDQGGSVGANTLDNPDGVFLENGKVIIADNHNHRILIYNIIPKTANALADVVVGQPDFTSSGINRGQGAANPGANTFYYSQNVFSDGQRLYTTEWSNSRVLIFNNMPVDSNASADVVVGQADFTHASANQGNPNPSTNTVNSAWGVWSDGKKLIIGDRLNNRVLIYNSIPASNNVPADVVVGQPNFTSKTANQGLSRPTAYTLSIPRDVFSDGKRLFVVDQDNNRVLIYNSIPTANNASADVVIGQPDFNSNAINQGGSPAANTLNTPVGLCTDGKRLFITDVLNQRLLVYNNIPTTNNVSADVVIGQPDFNSNSANQGGIPAANTLWNPNDLNTDGKRLIVSDWGNNRVLIYDIGGSSIELGPQFDQGKAVLGKVFEDKNANGRQDKGEKGIEGVKVVSDSGIYAITDEDGKYHFPYIETGQRLLKIDTVTLPEGSIFTTDNPYRVIVTAGVLTKVSFGVKLPDVISDEINSQLDNKEGPLLKVSVSQDPLLLKPRLIVSAQQDKDKIIFKIDCNYFLFVETSKLNIYTQGYKLVKSIELSDPIPSRYVLPLSELLGDFNKLADKLYYQFCVYDKNNKENRTSVGEIDIQDIGK